MKVNQDLAAKVTVIIPAFNAQNFIRETIKSALAAKPFEVIVVNDGSSDGTIAVVELLTKTYPSLKLINKANGGESSAINLGLTLVRTQYVLFLSADDLIDPSLLWKAAILLDDETKLVAAYPSWKVIDNFGHAVKEITDIDFSLAGLVGELKCLPGPGSVIRTSAIQTGRNTGLSQLPDLDQWLSMVRLGPLAHMEETLASWRQHDSNMSLKSHGAKLSVELDQIYQTVQANFRSGDSTIWSRPLWITFKTHWHRWKAIAESRVPFSTKSLIHLAISFANMAKAQNPPVTNPWSFREILGCLIPPVVWLRDVVSVLRKG
jgi:glycosyltransferase involved in cell wall biosynthesis